MTVSRVAVFCGVTLSLLAVSVTSAWAGDCANHNAKLDGLQADMKEYLGRLALLWQIYSRRFSIPIHFRQCGHRFDGS